MREARTPDIASTPLERDVSTLAIPRRGAAGRLWSALLAAWGVFIGLLPHILHHVGPLAGAALLYDLMHFGAVGNWYVDFDQVDDEEVLRLLDEAAARSMTTRSA